ncbi:hypothetical protein CBOM_04818 [Ceraceosorus bombacis]|uniref:Uncharacterized protein n=1 Tax=Ceraceosorus bombacis TaxID=401625 RepID=A0A0P1BNF5_9BASI|nr:hypothetical protein CBOM_04818 [Ceraceosorus bombacis]
MRSLSFVRPFHARGTASAKGHDALNVDLDEALFVAQSPLDEFDDVLIVKPREQKSVVGFIEGVERLSIDACFPLALKQVPPIGCWYCSPTERFKISIDVPATEQCICLRED